MATTVKELTTIIDNARSPNYEPEDWETPLPRLADMAYLDYGQIFLDPRHVVFIKQLMMTVIVGLDTGSQIEVNDDFVEVVEKIWGNK